MLTDDERLQIEAACRADHQRGWSGIFPDRVCINAEVERIIATRVEAALAEAKDRIHEARQAIAAIGPIGDACRNGYMDAEQIVTNLRQERRHG